MTRKTIAAIVAGIGTITAIGVAKANARCKLYQKLNNEFNEFSEECDKDMDRMTNEFDEFHTKCENDMNRREKEYEEFSKKVDKLFEDNSQKFETMRDELRSRYSNN